MDRQVHSQRQNFDNQDVSVLLINAGRNWVVNHPKISISYVIGILLFIFGTGIKPTPQQVSMMEEIQDQAERDYGIALKQSLNRLQNAEGRYYPSRGWFGSCDAVCLRFKEEYDYALADYESVKAKYESKLVEANTEVGVFSTYGVEKSRDLFWRMFAAGKGFAKQQTMWDALFIGLGAMSRDESIVEYGIRVLFSILFNFTLGLFGALVAFIWNLWAVVQSFGAGLLTGTFFFLLATIAAASFCISWLLGLYAAVAGTVYVAAKSAANAQIEQARRRQELRQDRHYRSD